MTPGRWHPNDRVAHDILCIARYGSTGGNVPADDVKRVRAYLEREGLLERPTPALSVPTPPRLPVVPVIPRLPS